MINIDDTFGARLATQSEEEVMLTYGIDQRAKIKATQIQMSVLRSSRFTLKLRSRNFNAVFR